MDNINEKIFNLYNSGGYWTKYASDVWITVILILIVFYTIMYFNILNNLQPIKANWVNQRCSPAVMPFASIINKPTDQSGLEFTASNFTGCVQEIVEDATQYALMPLYYVINTMTEVFNDLISAVNAIRDKMNSIRNSVSDEAESINTRVLDIMLPIVSMIQKLGSIAGKIQGSLIAGLYTAYGGFITTESAALWLYELIINLMYIIVAFIVTCFAVGWLFPPMLATGIAAASFMAILLIPFIVMTVIMNDIMGQTNLKSPPGLPSYCFTGETLIETNMDKVRIDEIKIGSKLKDGSKVTAFMKMSAKDCILYNLGGITVTENHKVFKLGEGWINVKNHPDSKKIENKENYLYCLGTDTKIIKIDKYLFSDFDEIDDEDIEELKENLSKDSIIKTRFDIHKNLESALDENTIIELNDLNKVKINEIKIGSKLNDGSIVTGLVEIKTDDINEFGVYKLNNVEIYCTKNTELNLGEERNSSFIKIKSPNKCYHLLTDKGGFYYKNVFISNYGVSIDRYLSFENLNNPKLK
ncbi:hypothetical protein N9O88_00625 [bacterium]|nr:hypothetical protein [bacterium]